MFDNFLPLVSLLQGEPYLPANPLVPAEDIENRDLDGWAWQFSSYDIPWMANFKDDQAMTFDFLGRYLEQNPDSTFMPIDARPLHFLKGSIDEYALEEEV
jgi:hypothetical protein